MIWNETRENYRNYALFCRFVRLLDSFLSSAFFFVIRLFFAAFCPFRLESSSIFSVVIFFRYEMEWILLNIQSSPIIVM